MKSKIASVILGAALVAALAAGSTLALFRDGAQNPDNALYAGTVSISVSRDLGDPIPGPMFYTTLEEGRTPGGVDPRPENVTGPWAPGDTITRILDVHNDGDLDVYIDGVSMVIQQPVVLAPPHLAYKLLATVFAFTPGGQVNLVSNVPLDQLATSVHPFAQRLLLSASGGNRPLYFRVQLPAVVGDVSGEDPDGTTFMGQRLMAQFLVHATQVDHNP